MDSKELRNLHEAYMDVYAPQENIEEGLRSAVKRLLGGGKKEAESSKPESRGEQLRKKYNVGPEKSDTIQQRDKSLIGLVQKRKKMKKIMEINHSRSKLLKNLKQHTTDI
jgi:hypothetical protein